MAQSNYTATVQSVDLGTPNPGVMTVTVLFHNATNGKSFVVPFVVSDPDSLPQIVLNQAKQYDIIDSAQTAPPSGVIAYPTPGTTPTPDPVVVQFQTDLVKLKHLRNAVDLGIITASNPALVSQTTTVQSQLTATPSLIQYV